MELYFLRHGIAAKRGGPKYKDDSLRPLTAQGILSSPWGTQVPPLTGF